LIQHESSNPTQKCETPPQFQNGTFGFLHNDSTPVLIIGGYTDGALHTTFFHTFGTDYWTTGLSMVKSRNKPGCRLLVDQKHYVRVAGSYLKYLTLTNTFGSELEVEKYWFHNYGWRC
jgi:hypothetical protein